MPSRQKTEPTALKTGLKHGAYALTALGALFGIVAGVVSLVGDETVGASHAEINLFADRHGASPVLKARLKDHSGAAQIQDASHVADAADHEEDHGLDVKDPETEDKGEVRILSAEKPDENGAVRINVSEQLADQSKAVEVAQENRRPLRAAPIAGFYERGPVGRLPKIADDGTTPAQIYARTHVGSDKPKIALIVGGLGLKYSLTMQAIRDLPPEVTLSFVPYSNNLQTYVNAARKAGHEVLLELPMEPYDYPNVDTGPETLLTTVTETENERRLKILLGKTTGYYGVINYQGAKLATDHRALDPILAHLKERGLVFYYDGGAPRAVFESVAEDVDIQFAEADRIVDARPTSEAIDRNLLHLEALALQNGQALGVGFAYPVTVDQLRNWAETLDYRGYELVPASMSAGVTAIDPEQRS